MTLKTLAGLVLATGLVAMPALAGHSSMSLDDARAMAEKSDKPVLVKVGTEWCAACKAFDKAVAENAAFKSKIADRAVLVQIDAEKGSGIEVAKMYGVHGYPSFVLTTPEGEVLDRWMGFGETAEFKETLLAATTNPMTVDQRIAKFAKEPNEADALKIGDLRLAEGLAAEASQYYHRAASLNDGADHSARVFRAVAYGAKKGAFTADDVRAQADVVYASDASSNEDVMEVLHTMRGIAGRTGDMAYYVPYLETAFQRTEGAEGWIAEARTKMAADYVLHVEKNVDKAITTKKASLAEGWMDSSEMLNSFAWWCYENKVNLEEAEQLARRGVELADSGVQKALVLDTLAELCNVNGNCGESLDLIRMAIAEDPTNDYYARQEERFAELLVQQGR